MKKSELKKLVQECIKEVLVESVFGDDPIKSLSHSEHSNISRKVYDVIRTFKELKETITEYQQFEAFLKKVNFTEQYEKVMDLMQDIDNEAQSLS